MRTQWRVRLPSGESVSTLTIYGDSDDATDRALLIVLREAIAISRVSGFNGEVLISCDQVALPASRAGFSR